MNHASDTLRERIFNLRISAEEQARLERVAAHYGLNAAGVIRFLLKREDDLIARHAATIDRVALGIAVNESATVGRQDAVAKVTEHGLNDLDRKFVEEGTLSAPRTKPRAKKR